MATYQRVRHGGSTREKLLPSNNTAVTNMTGVAGFEWVDFAARGKPGFRNTIVRLSQVPELMERYRQTDCYTTYFRFDHHLLDHVRQNGGSVAGYRGPVAASILPFDIDSEDLSKALRTTQDLCRFLLDSWSVPEAGLVSYYSGKKGFHLSVATAVFGNIEPSEDLPSALQSVRQRIVRDARPRYPETIDSIGDRLRLLRLPGSYHTGTGRYKVELTLGELFDSGVQDIQTMASEPKELMRTDPTGLIPMYDVGAVGAAEECYADCTRSAREKAALALPDAETFLRRGDLDGFLCAAEQKLYEQGVPEGTRSWTALRFASRMRSAGYREDEATALASSWNGRNDPPMRDTEARRIVGVAYRGRPYQYGCGTGAGDAPATRLVFEACPYTDRLQCQFYGAFQRQRTGADGVER